MIQILEVKDVCKILKVSRTTLAFLPIQKVKIGKREKYLLSDITDFIKQNKINTDYKLTATKNRKNEKEWIKDQINNIKGNLNST